MNAEERAERGRKDREFGEQAAERLRARKYESLGPAARSLVAPPPLPAQSLNTGDITELVTSDGRPAAGPCLIPREEIHRAGWNHAWQQRRDYDDPSANYVLCWRCGATIAGAAVTLVRA